MRTPSKYFSKLLLSLLVLSLSTSSAFTLLTFSAEATPPPRFWVWLGRRGTEVLAIYGGITLLNESLETTDDLYKAYHACKEALNNPNIPQQKRALIQDTCYQVSKAYEARFSSKK